MNIEGFLDDVHVFSRGGAYLGVHGRSMHVFELGEQAYRLITRLKSGAGAEDVEGETSNDPGSSGPSEHRMFLKQLYDAIASDPPELQSQGKRLVVENLMFLVAEDCNLRCDYCFAKHGTYGKPQRSRRMSFDVAKTALDCVIDGGYLGSYCIVCYFGGEPMLNFNLVREITEYAAQRIRSKGVPVGFALTTNGTLMHPDRIEYLLDKSFGIMVSLDGDKELHDAHRRTKGGRGTYSRVLSSSRTLLRELKERQTDAHIMARATLTSEQPDICEVAMSLHQVGFDHIIVDPVSSNPTDNAPFALQDRHVERYRQSFQAMVEKLADDIRSGSSCWYTPVGWFLKCIKHRTPKLYPCGAGSRFFVVDAEGAFYPCQRWVSHPDHLIGSAFDGIDEKRREEVLPPCVETRSICRNCWARYYCGGFCPAESKQYFGDIQAVVPWRCEMTRAALESCVWLYHELSRIDEALIDKVLRDGKPFNPAIAEAIGTELYE